MTGTRSLIGVALGGTCFALLLLVDRIGLAYTVLAGGGLALGLLSSASLNWQILVAASLGVASGLLIQSSIDPADALRHIEALRVIGSLFIAALKMFIAPMILLSIVYGIARMAAARELGRIGARTVALYLFTMALAVSTGLILVNIFQPGVGSELAGSRFLETAAGASQAAEQFGSVPEFLYPTLQQILSNPFSSLSQGRILPIVVFAILFGVALLQLGPAAAGLIEAIGGGYQAIMKIIGWILRLAPIGIFALIAKLLATVPIADLALHLGEFAGVVILGTLIHACLTLPLIARLLAGISPLHLFRAIRDALLVAFSTSSSAATLPVTTRCVEENLGVPSHVSSFVLPLGATVNMDGTALYEAVAAVFIAAVYGIDLDLTSQLIIFFVAMATAVGAPGIPSAGMVTMVVVLEAVNLPSEAVGILLTIDRFLDTFRTMANVEGDAVVAACVSRALRSP